MNPRTKRRIILSSAVAGGLAVAIAAGMIARTAHRDAQLVEKKQEGLTLFAAGKFENALEPLAFAARNNRDAEVVLALAECRMRVPEANGRHLSTAAGYFRAVQAADQKNVRAMRGLLEAYIGLGQLPEIPPLVHRLLAVEPNDVRAREIELEVLNLTGKFTEAAAKSRELQAIEPNNGRWRSAELLSLERAGADAEGRLARIREWKSGAVGDNDPGLRLLEADLQRETGRGDESRSMLRAIAAAGVAERKQLEALIGGIEAGGFAAAERDALVDAAIANSRGALSRPGDASEIEGQRLLRAGRLDELNTKFASAPASDAAVFRLRFAGLYLAGKRSEAAAFVKANAPADASANAETPRATDAFRIAAAAACSDEPARARIERIAGAGRVCPKDPVAAILLADVMIEAGEFDEAQSILVQSFEQSGDVFQPVGVRAIRASVSLGRVRDAFRIAESLLVRYGLGGDGSVAMLAVEAWAAALEANYQPATRGGVFGTDSPEALRRFWTALNGPDAKFGPAELAPLVADVFLARGDRDAAREILQSALADGGKSFRDLGSGRLSLALKTASALDPSLQGAIVGGVEQGASSAELAAVIAERFIAQGDKDAAIRSIDRALATATGADKRRLERLRRPLVDPNGLAAWLETELSTAPGLDTAIFVLSRAEAWGAKDDTLVRAAVTQMKDAIGAESLRALVAEAAMNMTFHGTDRSKLASSMAALDAAAMRSPDSASVLTTLAALFERQTPAQFDRSAKLLQRAVEAEPGSATIYPQLVSALQQTGDFAGAERALEAYIRIVGDDLQSKRSVADFKARQGQLFEAAQIREQLVGRSKEIVDAIALARIRQRMGDTAAATAILENVRGPAGAADVRPEGAEYTRALLVEREMALLLARDGRMPDARASLDKAEHALGGARFDEVRANVELAFGDTRAALAIAERLAAAESTAAHELLLARTNVRLGDLAKAREALARALTLEPDNADATTVAAALLVGDPAGRAMLQRSLAAASGRQPDLAAAIALLDSVTTPDGRIVPDEAALIRAAALTGSYSGSPLAWRVATQFHLLADRKDDAYRIAQRALTRLPSEASIGKLATETAIAAGRAEDAASCAAAWRKMATAEPAEVDAARAMIEILGRRPGRAFEILRPIAKEILTQSSDGSAVRALIAAAVLSGRYVDIRAELAGVSEARRGEIIGAWIESAQALPMEQGIAAIDEIAGVAKSDPVSHAACVAAWTSMCRSGSAEACSRASEAMAALASDQVPVAILSADLAAAKGDIDAAAKLYRAQFEPVIGAFGKDVAEIAARATRDAAIGDALRENPAAIVALNNLADALVAARRDSATAVSLAQIAVAGAQGSADILDTLVRALLADGRTSEALAIASTNPDPVLAAVEMAEIELARKSTAEARRALARVDARMQGTFMPMRTLSERVQRIGAAISRVEASAEGHQP